MSIQEFQYEKKNLINWINQIEDFSVIEKLKSIRDNSIEIPQWQKEEVLSRIKNAKPEDYTPWEKALNDIESSL